MTPSRRPTTPRRSSAGGRTRPTAPVAPAVVASGNPLAKLTGRAVVLLLVLAALVMTLALPLREYLQQRSSISALEQEVAARQSRVDRLTGQQLRWSDPHYVEMQARERLHYVYPGETGYVVLSQHDVRDAKQPVVQVAAKVRQPWYDTVWSSVQAADSAD